MRYPVNEIFTTIQGEAYFTGTPSVFIRLQGCPVGCPWCDTKHTWHVHSKAERSITEIIAKNGEEDTHYFAYFTEDDLAEHCKNTGIDHVVITGGEPCLYDLEPLTSLLFENGHTVQVETSGTHEVKAHIGTWITVSPKFDMPGGLPVLEQAIGQACEIKMPVGKQADIDEILCLVPEIRKERYVPIWLQPLSQSKKATKLCVEACLKYDFKLSLQTHKYMGIR